MGRSSARERLRGPQLPGFALDPRSGFWLPKLYLGSGHPLGGMGAAPTPRPVNFAGGRRSGSGVWVNLTRALRHDDERSITVFSDNAFPGTPAGRGE